MLSIILTGCESSSELNATLIWIMDEVINSYLRWRKSFALSNSHFSYKVSLYSQFRNFCRSQSLNFNANRVQTHRPWKHYYIFDNNNFYATLLSVSRLYRPPNDKFAHFIILKVKKKHVECFEMVIEQFFVLWR